MHRETILTALNAWCCWPVLSSTYLLQDMLLKRAADIAEALYSVPRPHSQLQALPSSPAHGSVMGLGSYPSQLGVSIGEPGQSSQGVQSDYLTEAHQFPGRTLQLMQICSKFSPIGYIRNSSSLSPRGYPSASTPQQSGYGGSGGMTGGYGTVPMTSLGVPGSPGFNSASPTGSPYSKTISFCAITFTFTILSALMLTSTLYLTVMPSSPTVPGSSSSTSSLLPFSSFPSASKQKSAFAPVLRPQGSPSPACPASGGNSFRGSHPTHYLTPLSELTNAV